jgi:hypothetical protein
MAGSVPIDHALPTVPTGVRIAGRRFVPGADRGVAVLLTAAGWVIQRLPGQVLEGQRAELIRTLGQAQNLVVEVQCSPTAAVRVKDGHRLLVEIPTAGRQDGGTRASAGQDVGENGVERPTRIQRPGNGSGAGLSSPAECVRDRFHCSSSVLAVSSAEWMPSIARN